MSNRVSSHVVYLEALASWMHTLFRSSLYRTEDLRQSCSWKYCIVGIIALAILWAFGRSSVAIAQEPAQKSSTPELTHVLENLQFAGPFGVEKETNPADDVLSFKNGMFSSQTCIRYGFSPAPYWVRRDARGLRFLTELQSSEHGTMRFEGVFDGKEMLATAIWTKKRWYWTIEQKFHFRGRPAGPAR